MGTLVAPLANLAVLLGFLFYKLKGPFRAYVAGRHDNVGAELKRVRELLRQAQERHEEFSAKLKAIEVETSALREQARQDAQSAKLRILSEAQRLSGAIISDARGNAEGLFADLRQKLFAETGGRILDRAEKFVRERLTGDDRARIRQELSHQLETMQ
jgi:F0F1-type ATP synthase membrane subunit b/b'